ncbi:hypothetical protein ABZ611_22840 [Streptomyces sp. NPDC007861]|uniref:hypothetical protein n=1 Tax=Streptomyces sp. NPDC007861 TaxID=3154893 RepID=UPI0033DD5F89
MIERSKVWGWLDVAMDWWGLAFCVYLLVVGIGSYRDGGPLAWPIMGGLGVLGGLWTVGRRIVRWYRRPAAPQA